jgi:hypothetical protein
LVPSFLCFQLFDFVFFFCDAGNGTQGLIHARQVVYHWATATPLLFGCNSVRVLEERWLSFQGLISALMIWFHVSINHPPWPVKQVPTLTPLSPVSLPVTVACGPGVLYRASWRQPGPPSALLPDAGHWHPPLMLVPCALCRGCGSCQ